MSSDQGLPAGHRSGAKQGKADRSAPPGGLDSLGVLRILEQFFTLAPMGFVEVLIIAVGLAMDAFAVSLGAGTSGRATGGRAAFRLSFHFGLFQFMMPVIGWFLGTKIAPLISSVDHWIAFGLLVVVGLRMIRSGLNQDGEIYTTDPSRGLTLVVLAIATSIDALAIGLGLAMMRVKIWYPSVIIGVVTGGLSLLGIQMGTCLGARFGKRMEVAGGILLNLIGLRILASHWFV